MKNKTIAISDRANRFNLSPIVLDDIVRLNADKDYANILGQSKPLAQNLDVVTGVLTLLNPEIDQLRNLDIVLLLGPTRSGKSTTLLYLDGTEMTLRDPIDELGFSERDVDADTVMVPEQQNHPDWDHIGHYTAHSHTFFPRLHAKPLHGYPNLRLVDFPGFFDSAGWQVRMGFDLVLKKICQVAKSVRVVLILDSDSIGETTGEIAKRSVAKIRQIFQNPADSVLVGVTKRNTPWPQAFTNTVNAYCGDMRWVKMHQSNSGCREDIVGLIVGLNPVVTNTTLVASDDLVSFRECIGRPEAITEQIAQLNTIVAPQFHVSESATYLTKLLINFHRPSSLYLLAQHIGDQDIPSILARFGPRLYQEIFKIGEPNLCVEILNIEQKIVMEIFAEGIRRVKNEYDLILKKIQSGRLVFSTSQIEALTTRYTAIQESIKGMLEIRNLSDQLTVENRHDFLMKAVGVVGAMGAAAVIGPLTALGAGLLSAGFLLGFTLVGQISLTEFIEDMEHHPYFKALHKDIQATLPTDVRKMEGIQALDVSSKKTYLNQENKRFQSILLHSLLVTTLNSIHKLIIATHERDIMIDKSRQAYKKSKSPSGDLDADAKEST